MNRRGFLTGLGASLVSAPAIVRAGSLMPVKVTPSLDFETAMKMTFRGAYAEIYGDYANLPPQWQDRFAPHHPDHPHHLRLS
jgi:hypothetical protein